MIDRLDKQKNFKLSQNQNENSIKSESKIVTINLNNKHCKIYVSNLNTYINSPIKFLAEKKSYFN